MCVCVGYIYAYIYHLVHIPYPGIWTLGCLLENSHWNHTHLVLIKLKPLKSVENVVDTFKRSLKFTCKKLSYWGILQRLGRTWLLDIMMRGCQLLRALVTFHWEGPLLFGENCHSKAIADKYLASLEFILEFLSPSSWLDLNTLVSIIIHPNLAHSVADSQSHSCCSVPYSHLTLCDPMDCSMLGSPVLHISRSLLKLLSIESVMPSNHLVLCQPLLLLPSVFPSIRVFSQWVSLSHEVAKVLELQLQHQSFQ